MWKNILYSGNDFKYEDKFVKYKFKLINIILITAITASLSMAIVIGFIGIDEVHSLVITLELLYCFINIFLFFFLRHNKDNLNLVIYIGMITLYILQVIVMINLLEDSLREAWYFLTLIISFLLAGRKFGYVMFSIIFLTMLGYNFQPFVETNLNIIESTIPLVLLVLIAFVMNSAEIMKEDYEDSLVDSNILLEKNIDKLNQFNINLESRIQQEIELSRKHESELFEQSKLVSMGEMIENIAHQWRQPLSVISTGATGMKIQNEYNVLTNEMIDKTCDTINNNAQYLSKTIDEFRNFIKGDRVKTIFSLTNNINSFLQLVESSLKNNNISIILNLNNDIKINGYENEFIQCFINIFNNTKDVLMDTQDEKKLIFIFTDIIKDNVIIKIKDNAKGIDSEVISRVFEPYFTTKNKSLGTGLGLHMVHSLIVDSMKGTINARNVHYKFEDNKYIGVEFTITLPIR